MSEAKAYWEPGGNDSRRQHPTIAWVSADLGAERYTAELVDMPKSRQKKQLDLKLHADCRADSDRGS